MWVEGPWERVEEIVGERKSQGVGVQLQVQQPQGRQIRGWEEDVFLSHGDDVNCSLQ